MRKIQSIFILALLMQFAGLSAQDSGAKGYYYAVGWEHLPQTEAAKLNFQPVVSNVVYINCGDYSYKSQLGVDNQLIDHYNAYYAKQRGYMSLNRTIDYGPYKTWDEAEKDRRKAIADYNIKWNPLILRDFRYLCKE